MEHPKIERLLQLIMLMASKTDYTIEDLACKLGTTSRSVYRYICTLRNAGFVIEKRKTNIYKLIHIPNSSVNLNTLVYFSQEPLKKKCRYRDLKEGHFAASHQEK